VISDAAGWIRGWGELKLLSGSASTVAPGSWLSPRVEGRPVRVRYGPGPVSFRVCLGVK
jgi:hypothetical protein